MAKGRSSRGRGGASCQGLAVGSLTQGRLSYSYSSRWRSMSICDDAPRGVLISGASNGSRGT
eukprot:6321989-Lingulodinium_polyedra.AAC.1